MPNFRKFRIILLVLIVLALGLSNQASAGEIILNDLSGKRCEISSLKGKPAVLFFWTTWCPYCRRELKEINQQSPALNQEGIVVFGVNVGETDYKVQKFFQGYALNFRVLLDKDGLLADQYGLLGVPTYVFLDKAGKVVAKTNRLPDNYKALLLK